MYAIRSYYVFEHAPYREVERIDVHRGTEPGREDMLADEGAAARDLFGWAVEIDVIVRHFSARLAGEHE